MTKQMVRISFVLSLLVALAMASVASAQSPFPGSGWYTSASIQNVSTTDESASVTLEVYPQAGGSDPSTASFTIAAGGGATFLPGSGGVNGNIDVSPSLSNFAGAAVVSSNQPIIAVGTFTNFRPFGFDTIGVEGGYASGQFNGAVPKSATLIYPTVKSGFAGKTTIFSVQSTNSSAATSYTATIAAADGETYTLTGSIPANGSTYLTPDAFDMPADCTDVSANTSPCFGSLSVVADSNIVGTYIEYAAAQSPGTVAQAAPMFAQADAGTVIYCPTMKNAYVGTRSTGLTVANPGTTDVTVDVDFTVAAVYDSATGTINDSEAPVGNTYSENGVTIGAGQSTTFLVFNENIGDLPTGALASAVVTASGPVVAVVSESNFDGTAAKSTVYACFNQSAATSTTSAPVTKKYFAGNSTGLLVQNANTTGSVNLTLDWVCLSGESYQTTFSNLAPGAGANIFVPSVTDIPDSSNCAVTVNAAGDTDKIIMVVNESSSFDSNEASINLDNKNFEGFNQ